ncbi:thiamine biosynthesis lipoprotein [Anaerobranca californiensis DSM 14826]|jgi:thiamine biosynthesis lipoprotein|uniref:FAD:protein FMN transferase n=1 Tax=Anaerobranca californiensis DSM 14826 TaxID=1120989 RepID=A0A1M6NK69_9FIRM|nr:FAD:protein FMN transferase [Anaerobranca californiensis]SHJ95922.1 thiamine biosynthesis lipoprotein [Anaerobranca californiensis DSM 14826]
MKKNLIILILIVSTILTGCKVGKENFSQYQTVRRTFFPMDTFLEIVLQVQDEKAANEAIDRAYAEVERLENLLSATIEKSEITAINKNAGIRPVKVSSETFYLLEKGIEYGELTDGKFDITIAPLLKLYNWKEGRVHGELPPSEEIKKAMELVNYQAIQLHEEKMEVYLPVKGMEIDLGGIAKGYIIDKAVEVLKEHGIKYGYVNGGGDIRFLGPKYDGNPWRIGITNPRGQGNIAVVEVNDGAIVTSGDYERYYITKDGQRIHHIIDPHTGLSAIYAQSVTIYASNATIADILSTTLFMFQPTEGLKLAKNLGVEALIISSNGEIYMTTKMKEMTNLN